MAEYLEREKLLEILRYRGTQYAPKPFEGGFVSGWHEAIDEIESDVEDIPAADVHPERHGRWSNDMVSYMDDFNGDMHIGFQCSKCKAILNKTKYCGNCGAKMDGKDGGNNE